MRLPGEKLRDKGRRHLMSYFNDEKDRNAINEKFMNLYAKTPPRYVPNTLFTKRTARKGRALIPFSHVVNNELTYDQLDTFENGVVVEFVNNDYFEQLKLTEKEQNEVFKKLKDKLGSDDNVSAMIDIRSTGLSSSQEERLAYEELLKFLDKNNLSVEECIIRRKKNYSGLISEGNEKWEGFIHYQISGGQQDVLDSHKQFGQGIEKKEFYLFIPSVDYTSLEVSIDISLVLIYFAMFSIPKSNRKKAWNDLLSEIEMYLSVREYDTGTLLEYVQNHISLQLIPGKLTDPIQCRAIKIEDFASKTADNESIDLTHQESVNKQIYVYDNKLETLLTPARPTNVFWSKKLSNMM
ncbi:MAG: hypothetical protein GX217_00225 [Clostridiaceae bacterium]|nr:hypothetical protein [Clostridiaceae bacterium]